MKNWIEQRLNKKQNSADLFWLHLKTWTYAETKKKNVYVYVCFLVSDKWKNKKNNKR